MNTQEAVEKLHEIPLDGLRELMYDLHKDIYGVKGRHLLSCTKAELVSWHLHHYRWDEERQVWAWRVEPEDDEDDLECDFIPTPGSELWNKYVVGSV